MFVCTSRKTMIHLCVIKLLLLLTIEAEQVQAGQLQMPWISVGLLAFSTIRFFLKQYEQLHQAKNRISRTKQVPYDNSSPILGYMVLHTVTLSIPVYVYASRDENHN